ncbi:hypothetical protein A3D81_02095 [Candidatus Curtissbacteria bacterium RIFCSPHIGHO2_02_FULL_40_17]|nr:MAG: hypothetical protein A3D81_02095 [Candidatus Curtissbacteria bacterium RIFCSPHIGHO2_02_FULL_40_17]
MPGIIGIGKSVGRKLVTNHDIAEAVAQYRNESRGRNPDLLPRLRNSVLKMLGPIGTDTRYWADEEQCTSDLATEASLEALRMAEKSPREITSITLATMSQDYLGVPVAPVVQYRLETKNGIPAKDIQAACAGTLYALHDVFKDLTSQFGSGGPQLAIGAEVLSKHIHPSHPDTYGLFGDAAGALVIDMVEDRQGDASKVQFHLGADGQFQTDLLIPGGGTKHPTSMQTVEDGMHCLQMNGPIIEAQAIRRMAESTEAVLKKANLKPGEISLFIPHQANKEIIIKTAKLLNFPIERVYININRYGNTSAATIPLAMHDAYYEGRLNPDEMIVVASLGAGLVFGAATLSTTGLPKRSTVSKLRFRLGSAFPSR